jgi:mannose-6-phosphate isomerase-like protein (cupin superfamily)
MSSWNETIQNMWAKHEKFDSVGIIDMNTLIEKPWGFEYLFGFIGLKEVSQQSKIKLLILHPGHQTSMQKHHYRDEFMVVLQGEGTRTTEDAVEGYKDEEISEGNSFVVEQRETHRLKNTGDISLIIAEIQIGKICDDEDIERISDDYGRGDEEEEEENPYSDCPEYKVKRSDEEQ